MPERLRTLVNRMRRFIGERRAAPRLHARLHTRVSLHEQHARNTHTTPHTLDGHTRDISTTGLAVILPAIRVGERYLTGDNRHIDVELELPSATIRLRATPVRYERLEEDADGETGYLLGARIDEMSDSDRARFEEYLRSLK